MDMSGFVGRHIVRIESDSPQYKRLSDLGENWQLDARCPSCDRVLFFDKNNVNKPTSCQCGQKIFVRIDMELL